MAEKTFGPARWHPPDSRAACRYFVPSLACTNPTYLLGGLGVLVVIILQPLLTWVPMVGIDYFYRQVYSPAIKSLRLAGRLLRR